MTQPHPGPGTPTSDSALSRHEGDSVRRGGE
ncbi:hypothetical protein QFZ49_006906 [Streptomyces turgidiscabies]|uniref:Uncharacterized protein n=1 Tax=Streptomyces turgidiscabies TaxID=85558 RepID=A0ABU0RY93_9ACTN|nr:hypothetical protein [Streptomyces turgidiscabies]